MAKNKEQVNACNKELGTSKQFVNMPRNRANANMKILYSLTNYAQVQVSGKRQP